MFEKMDLNLNEMENVNGGNKAFDLAMEYRRYVDTLMAKYQCTGRGVDYLMTVCTPEEKAKISEMCKACFEAIK